MYTLACCAVLPAGMRGPPEGFGLDSTASCNYQPALGSMRGSAPQRRQRRMESRDPPMLFRCFARGDEDKGRCSAVLLSPCQLNASPHTMHAYAPPGPPTPSRYAPGAHLHRQHVARAGGRWKREKGNGFTVCPCVVLRLPSLLLTLFLCEQDAHRHTWRCP